MVVNVGPGPGVTVKITTPLVPPGVVTRSALSPIVVLKAMLNLAVALIRFCAMLRFVTVTPSPPVTVIGAKKFAPVKVTSTLVPNPPDAGVMEVSDGDCGSICRKPLAEPAAVKTRITKLETADVLGIVSLAVMRVESTTTTLSIVTVTPKGGFTSRTGLIKY